MKFNWAEYYTVAEQSYVFACKDPSCTIKEAHYRNSISRAYYAAFCEVRNYLKDKHNVKFHSDEHKKLQDHLSQQDRNKQKIGNQLKQLHQDRKRADYYDELKAPNKTAGKALSQAGRILANLKTLN